MTSSKHTLSWMIMLGLCGCATAPRAESQAQALPAALAALPPLHVVPPVVVDETPPTKLEAWRKLDETGKAAVRTTELGKRIEACKAWVAANPKHEGRGAVLAALTDAIVEKGGFDPAELAGYVEQRAELDEYAASLPLDLVRDYHVKHGLPAKSGLALLELARTRMAEAWQDLELETNERSRKWGEIRLHGQAMRSWLLAARLHRAAGDPALALSDLGEAEHSASKLGSDMVLVDGAGKTVHALATGGLDELHVLTAAVQLELGKEPAAKAALARAVGFLDDVELRKLYERTRDALGMKSGDDQVVKAELADAPKFVLEDLDGKKVELAKLRGKVVVLAFFATWCGPCKRELPALQKFARTHADKDVVLLAVSIDDFSARGKIRPFLRENDLDLRVLLEKPEQLAGFDYGSGIPALYVIDREGKIAHARTGFDPDLERKLSAELREIVEGKRAAGRELLTVDVAPAGFAPRWRMPISGDVSAIAVASAGEHGAGELAVVGRDGLVRYSATGQRLGAEPLTGYVFSLDATDLDGDGGREWVVAGWPDLKVLDAKGKPYWSQSLSQPGGVDAVVDLDGDGFSELVARAGDRIVAYKSVPDVLWRSRPLAKLEAVAAVPGGGLLAQADGRLVELDPRGNVRAKGREAPEGRVLVGRVKRGAAQLDLFRSESAPKAILGHDVDGDGRDDIVVTDREGVVAYDLEGNTILRMRAHDVGIETAVGDLDGKPGAELALSVQHFGVVVLGR